MNKEYHGIQIDLSKDRLFADYSKTLLEKYYLKEGETSPQEAFARTAVAYSGGDLALAQRIYGYASKKWLGFASPVLSNAPAPGQKSKGLPISCFLLYVPDTVEGLVEHTSELRRLSVNGGGVGGHWNAVRSACEKSHGVIPFLKTVDSDMLAWRQGKTRKGAYAAYMDVTHPEIMEFIEMRGQGRDDNRTCKNLNNAVNITDEFLNAVENDLDWQLIDPATKQVRDTFKARKLWEKILSTRARHGEPYINYIDEANKKLNPILKELGLKINGSNLCFTGDTLVATADGRNAVPIKDLAEESLGVNKFPVYSSRKRKHVNQFNSSTEGEKWVTEVKNAVALKTGTQKIIRLILSDGSTFECTPEHKLAIFNGDYVKASESKGVRLQHFFSSLGDTKKYRHINSTSNGYSRQHRLIWEFKNGAIPEGFNIDHIDNSPNDTLENLQLLTVKAHLEKTSKEFSDYGNAVYNLRDKSIHVHNKSSAVELERNPRYSGISNEEILQTALILKREGKKINKFTLHEQNSNIPWSFSKNRFNGSIKNLIDIVEGRKEYSPHIYKEKLEYEVKNIFKVEELSVVDIIDEGKIEDVYDLQVEDNHNFNIITRTMDNEFLQCSGILVHNCNEIHLATNEERTAVCCLSSLNLEYYDEWKDSTIVEDLVEFLDNVLQYFIDHAPDNISRAKFSAMQERSIGVGVMGFHTFLQKKRVAFESAIAKSWNKNIFKFIKERADKSSAELAVRKGAFPDWYKCMSQDNKEHFKRNAHLIAVAPTANNAMILDVSPSIEPYAANIYVQRSRIGAHKVISKYLFRLLEEKFQEFSPEELNGISFDEWLMDQYSSIINNEGSVQHLSYLNENDKATFKTAYEIDQRWVVDHARDRQEFIDQGQSVNLFFPSESTKESVNLIHLRAFSQKGTGVPLKGLYYYRTKAGSKAENVNKKVERKALEEEKDASSDECLACHS